MLSNRVRVLEKLLQLGLFANQLGIGRIKPGLCLQIAVAGPVADVDRRRSLHRIGMSLDERDRSVAINIVRFDRLSLPTLSTQRR